MAKRSPRLRVQDMLDSVEEVEEFVRHLDFQAYMARRTTRRAVERSIEIISEASRFVPDHLKAAYPQIPWKSIHGIGNVLRHDYQHVADLIMWRTATTSVPDLKPVLEAILAALPPDVD